MLIDVESNIKNEFKKRASQMKQVQPSPKATQLLGLAQTSLESFRATGYTFFLDISKDAIDELVDYCK